MQCENVNDGGLPTSPHTLCCSLAAGLPGPSLHCTAAAAGVAREGPLNLDHGAAHPGALGKPSLLSMSIVLSISILDGLSMHLEGVCNRDLVHLILEIQASPPSMNAFLLLINK